MNRPWRFFRCIGSFLRPFRCRFYAFKPPVICMIVCQRKNVETCFYSFVHIVRVDSELRIGHTFFKIVHGSFNVSKRKVSAARNIADAIPDYAVIRHGKILLVSHYVACKTQIDERLFKGDCGSIKFRIISKSFWLGGGNNIFLRCTSCRKQHPDREKNQSGQMPVFEFFVFWVAFDWFCSFARHRKQSADWLILRNTVLQVFQTSQNQAIRGSAAAPAASLASLSPVAAFGAPTILATV